RDRWKMTKRSQLGPPAAPQSQTEKDVKEKTLEEKREHARLRHQKCRENASRQRKIAVKEVDRQRKRKSESSVVVQVTEPAATTLSRSTIRRRVTAVKHALLSTQKSFATILKEVIVTSTPRKRDAVAKKGIDVKRSLEDELVLASVKESICKMKKH